ncbi:hypothetical protein [Peribacillus butanolivorans]
MAQSRKPSEEGGQGINEFHRNYKFTAELVGLLSDINEFLISDSNANLGIVFVGFFHNKKEKDSNLGN